MIILISYLYQDGEFDWNEKTQSVILGSFFWGYIITNLIGGRIAELVGGKKVYGFGILLTSVLTFLTPMAARSSLPLFLALRVAIGFGEVCYFFIHLFFYYKIFIRIIFIKTLSYFSNKSNLC